MDVLFLIMRLCEKIFLTHRATDLIAIGWHRQFFTRTQVVLAVNLHDFLLFILLGHR